MCFSPKMKVPKPNTNIPAPEPIPLESPGGVEFGSEESGSEGSTNESSTKNIARVDREDKGDGSTSVSALDRGMSSPKKFSYTSSAVRKSLTKKARR